MSSSNGRSFLDMSSNHGLLLFEFETMSPLLLNIIETNLVFRLILLARLFVFLLKLFYSLNRSESTVRIVNNMP